MKSVRNTVLDLALLPALAFLLCVAFSQAGAIADEPFKLGVQEKGFVAEPEQGYEDYPAPAMVPPLQGGASQGGLQGGARKAPTPPRKPIRASVTRSLPPQFLGVWKVSGQRTKVQAQPQYQAGIGKIFQMATSNTWQISGSAQAGYTMSNDMGVRTPMSVVKTQGNTAWIRYQHPIRNTVAQEALVLSLEPGGATFTGLERITIVKQGEPPRAQVQYKLIGRRQR